MPPLLGFSLASQGVSAAMQFMAQQRLKKQAQKAGRELKSANATALGNFDNTYSMLEGQDALQIDRTLFDAYEEFARNESLAVQGRAFGDEQAKDSVRGSASDSIARGLNVAGSGADAMGVVADANNREAEALNQIDSQSARARFGAIQEAKNRLLGASRDKAVFNQRADLQEFQDRRSRETMLAKLQMERSGMERDFRLGEISQDGAIAGAGAAQLSSFGDGISSIGSSLFDMHMNGVNNDFLKGMMGSGDDTNNFLYNMGDAPKANLSGRNTSGGTYS
jgi:hypothetical protein